MEEIERAGAGLHVIGNGVPRFIAGFRDDTGYRGAIYTDPTLAVYRATEMRRGAGTFLHPRAWANGLRAFRAGFRQARVQGDAEQTGGVLIVTPDGRVPYHYVSKVAGDHPPVDAILAALR